jgi:hypothetical protein
MGLCGRTGFVLFFRADFPDFGAAEFAFFEFFFGLFAFGFGEFEFAFFFAFEFFFEAERGWGRTGRRRVCAAHGEQEGREDERDREQLELAWHRRIHRLAMAPPLAVSA